MSEDRIYTNVAVIGGDPESTVDRCFIFNNVTIETAIDLFSARLREATGFNSVCLETKCGNVVLGVKHVLASDTMIQSF